MNKRTNGFTAAWALGLALALAGCGASVNPNGDGGRDAGFDASGPFCMLPNGGRCAAGTSCPAGDGCNNCSCPAGGGFAQCTLLACVTDGGGPTGCSSAADCGGGMECVFGSASCGATGRCEPPTPCAAAQPFCGCDGLTYESCRPTRPTRHEGPCEGPPPMRCDATRPCPPDRECIYPIGCGTPGTCQSITDCAAVADFCGCDNVSFRACPNRPDRPAASAGACSPAADAGAGPCAGARLDPRGAQCLSPSGTTLPVSCCSGWNCDVMRGALCEIVPPPCAAGTVHTVSGGCFGPCVPPTQCAPMMCLDGRCPTGFRCGPSGQCVAN